MVLDSWGRRRTFDAAEVTRVINATTSVLRDRIEEVERAILEKAPKAKLDMEATLVRGDATLPVTIAPYRIVSGENRGEKSPRIGIPGEADLERVTRAYEEYNEMANSLNELQRIGRDPVARRKLIEGFLKSVEDAAKEFLKDTRGDLEKAAELAEPEVAAVQEAAEVLLEDVERIVDAVEELRSSTDPLVVAERAAALLRFVTGEELQDHLAALRDSIPDTPPEGLGAAAKALLARLKENLAAQVDKLAAALADQPGGGEIASLFTSLEALREIAQTRAFEDLDDGRITRRSFSIETAQDGIIDLERTQADDGDRLSIDYRLVVNPGEAEERTHSVSSSLGVRKFGLYTSYEAQLIFYDRLGDGSSAYQAAPGIAYNFHYRPESAQDFFDVVAPGVGFNVSSPSFESGADLAVGVQVTLFQNLLQAGYAYNISVEDDPEMFFFGLDLISAFRAAE